MEGEFVFKGRGDGRPLCSLRPDNPEVFLQGLSVLPAADKAGGHGICSLSGTDTL